MTSNPLILTQLYCTLQQKTKNTITTKSNLANSHSYSIRID